MKTDYTKQKLQLIAALTHQGPSTVSELKPVLDWDHSSYWSRLSELCKANVVTRVGKRQSVQPGGRMQSVYALVG